MEQITKRDFVNAIKEEKDTHTQQARKFASEEARSLPQSHVAYFRKKESDRVEGVTKRNQGNRKQKLYE